MPVSLLTDLDMRCGDLDAGVRGAGRLDRVRLRGDDRQAGRAALRDAMRPLLRTILQLWTGHWRPDSNHEPLGSVVAAWAMLILLIFLIVFLIDVVLPAIRGQ